MIPIDFKLDIIRLQTALKLQEILTNLKLMNILLKTIQKKSG